jgi:hypothetical protein
MTVPVDNMGEHALISEPADTVEDVGFFFKFLGGVQFVGHKNLETTGHSRVLQVAPQYGLFFFVNGSGRFCLDPLL